MTISLTDPRFTYVVVNGLNTVTNPVSDSQQFFRLGQAAYQEILGVVSHKQLRLFEQEKAEGTEAK